MSWRLAGHEGRWSGRPDEHVRLVTRLLVAQSITAAAIGLLFSRRQLATIIITLVMVAAMCLLATLARSGTRAAWMTVFGLELILLVYGLSRFLVARYVGGTLFALITVVTLASPRVAGAYGVHLGRGADVAGEPVGAADTAPAPLPGDDAYPGHPIA
jgi:hypothetical protein